MILFIKKSTVPFVVVRRLIGGAKSNALVICVCEVCELQEGTCVIQ